MSTGDTPNAAESNLAATFRVEGFGSGDRTPYAKADFAKVCRVGDSYAFSFYQMDYQDAVNALLVAQAKGQAGDVPAQLIPVAKVVFDAEGFGRFVQELNQLLAKIGMAPK